MGRVARDFFLADAVRVARLLPGMDIVMAKGREQVRYMITETEAYLGETDLACHASKGRSQRTEPLYLEGGHLYLYLIYGMYWMLNIVTAPAGEPQAVLIRGVTGFSGPGRLTRGLAIENSFNREDVVTSGKIWIEESGYHPELITGPRVGIDYAGEPWVSMPWRFIVKNEKQRDETGIQTVE